MQENHVEAAKVKVTDGIYRAFLSSLTFALVFSSTCIYVLTLTFALVFSSTCP